MADFQEVDTDTRRGPHVERGRYVAVHPETGKSGRFTRVTNFADTLKDRYGLEKWSQRNIVFGIGQRPALYAKASSLKLTDVKGLDEVASRAQEAADSKAGADVGEALHTFTERIDAGEQVDIPPPYARDIEAYRRACELKTIETCIGWIERIVFVPGLELIGKLDRLNTSSEWSLSRIGDVKTATDKHYDDGRVVNTVLTYGMVDIPLQLAIYANASHWWDPKLEQWVEMPSVDRDKAMVFHVPAGLGECRIYEVDIAAGWDAAQLAMDTRTWRKRKDLAETVLSIGVNGDTEDRYAAKPEEEDTGVKPAEHGPGKGDEAAPVVDPPAPPSSSVNPERLQWTADRVAAIKAHEDVNAKRRLAGLWSLRDEIPTFPKGGPRTDEELSVVIGMCDLVEMEFSMPFGPPDPAAEVVGGTYSERRRAQHEADEEAKAKAMSKARTTRKAKGTKA